MYKCELWNCYLRIIQSWSSYFMHNFLFFSVNTTLKILLKLVSFRLFLLETIKNFEYWGEISVTLLIGNAEISRASKNKHFPLSSPLYFILLPLELYFIFCILFPHLTGPVFQRRFSFFLLFLFLPKHVFFLLLFLKHYSLLRFFFFLHCVTCASLQAVCIFCD